MTPPSITRHTWWIGGDYLVQQSSFYFLKWPLVWFKKGHRLWIHISFLFLQNSDVWRKSQREGWKASRTPAQKNNCRSSLKNTFNYRVGSGLQAVPGALRKQESLSFGKCPRIRGSFEIVFLGSSHGRTLPHCVVGWGRRYFHCKVVFVVLLFTLSIKIYIRYIYTLDSSVTTADRNANSDSVCNVVSFMFTEK